MLILGLILLVLGFVLGIQILWIIGAVLAVIGLILLLMPVDRVGGHRWY